MDTEFFQSWTDFLKVLESNGFKIGYHNTFLDEGKTESELIAYHPMGVIVYANSFRGNMNHGTAYLEATPKTNDEDAIKDLFMAVHSGGLHDSGDVTFIDSSWDIRGGLMSEINIIESVGDIVPSWRDNKRFLWFVNYTEDDVEGYDYKKITNDKIALLPEEAQRIINRK
jgi:hypothetical protein